MRFPLGVFGLVLLFCDLRASTAAKPAPPVMTHDQVELTLRKKMETEERAVFVSRGGKMYGMDSDSIISFERDGAVIMGEYGMAYQGYRGTYEVAADGTITLKLKGFTSTWPAMRLAASGYDLWLYPATGKGGLVMGGRGGATETGSMNSFWPFKAVKGKKVPRVTPIRTGLVFKRFVSPVLPPGVHWQEGKVEFRVDFDIAEDGKLTVRQYFPWQAPEGSLAKDDWRLPILESVGEAIRQWEYIPLLEDGKPVPIIESLNFQVSQVDGLVHWVMKDDTNTVYDNMPRVTSRENREN